MQLHAQYYYQQLPPQERAAYHGMLTCLRELTPSARKAMPFASLKEARDDVLGKAEAGHPFCQYMIGNTYYFGDCFEIDGIDPQTAFHDPDGLPLELHE